MPEKARSIIQALPPFVKSVGVFVNEEAAAIREHVRYCGLDLIQLHGEESPEFCRKLMPRTIKAFRIREDSKPAMCTAYQGHVRALLLDTYVRDKAGGTGKAFDWQLAIGIKKAGIPVILSGGLGPSNIENAIRIVRPYAVDVNSGVEEHPGKKSPALMRELMEKVRRNDRTTPYRDENMLNTG
jgi:phosphoribosylanthranilate isomerase